MPTPADPSDRSPAAAWTAFVDGLRAAGDRLATQTAGLPATEQADAYRALLRGLNNQLGRFEVDRDRPELVFFNGWREKMFMDNPDFRYWVADVRDDGAYRISGTVGDAAYVSITAYTSAGTLEASASARLDSDRLRLGADGSFSVVLARHGPADGSDWLALPGGCRSVWVRQFHRDVANERLGTCTIAPLHDPGPASVLAPDTFSRHLERLGRTMGSFPSVWAHAAEADLAQPNAVRAWSEMAGGAAFTEPNIHYVRGAWRLQPDEALVIEGEPPPCRYWNAMLYSRHLNSLDHRTRTVSCTDGTARLIDGRYRLVLSPEPLSGPQHKDQGNRLDTEGREFGIFVLRFLQPEVEPKLPTVRVVPLAELEAEA